jgi:hypothetical protein
MAIIRGFFGVLLGAIVALILGALYDYLKLPSILNPEEWTYGYPWFAGISGLIGGLIAVLLFGSWQARALSAHPPSRTPREARPQAKAKQAASAKDKEAGLQVKTSSEVPGMPTFDLQADAGGEKKKEKDKQP